MSENLVVINKKVFLEGALEEELGEVSIIQALMQNMKSSRDCIVEAYPPILKDGRALAGASNRLTSALRNKKVNMVMLDDRQYANSVEIYSKVSAEQIKAMALESMSQRYVKILDVQLEE